MFDKFSTPCLDEPSKPQNVEVVDWDKDHADLKWTKPENDGGAPITGYIIEFKVRKHFQHYFTIIQNMSLGCVARNSMNVSSILSHDECNALASGPIVSVFKSRIVLLRTNYSKDLYALCSASSRVLLQ